MKLGFWNAQGKPISTFVTMGGSGLGSEKVVDGDMELANLTNWAAYSTPTTREKSNAQAYQGSQSLHIVADGAGEGAQQSLALEVATYRVSVYAKCASGTAIVYTNLQNLGFLVVGSTSSSSWTLITANIACATAAPRSFLLLGQATGADVYFDSASVRKLL